MKSNYSRLGEYIELINTRNWDLHYGESDVRGVSNNKEIIQTKANNNQRDFDNFYIVDPDDFIYNSRTSRMGDKVGLGFNNSGETFITSFNNTVFRVNNELLLPMYLFMWFNRPEFDRYARYHSWGSSTEIFSWDEMCNVELPIPSIEKQREIVKEYKTIVHRINLNQQLNQKLEETAQEIFEFHFIYNEVELSQEKRLGDLIEIKGGFSYHSSEIDQGEAYLLGMGCISFTSRFVEEGMRLYSNDFPEKHLVFPGDIVIATRQQSENMPILGYPAMIPPDLSGRNLLAASNLYRVVNNSDLSNNLLYQLLRSRDYIEHIKINTKGTTVGMITKDAIEDYYFKAPSDEILLSISKKLESLVNCIFTIRAENKNLSILKDLILSKMTQVEVEEKAVVG